MHPAGGAQDSGLAQAELLEALGQPASTQRSLAALMLWHWIGAGKQTGLPKPTAPASAEVRIHLWKGGGREGE